jgi:DNA-binding transcriptional LysR family regulator
VITERNTEHLLARLRFRHLQLLQTLAARGSLRAAAEALRQTQPALSKALHELEAMLGFPLFERTPRGLRPTPQGEVLVRGASLLIAELEHLRYEAGALQGRAQAVLRLGAPPFVALGLVPDLLAKLLQRQPPVFVRLTEERVPRLHELLRAGELDALLSTYSLEPEDAQGGRRLRREKLFDAANVVIAAPGWRGPRRPTWQALAGERWVLPGRGSFIRRLIEEMFLRQGLAAPQPIVESASPLTNAKLVAAGVGLSAVPETAAADAGLAGRIVQVKVTPRLPAAPVALVYRPETAGHPRISALREALELAAGL